MAENSTELISQRTIGDAVVTLVNEGGMDWPPTYPVSEEEWRVALPGAGSRGEIPIGFIVAHVQLGDASIMIDPGLDEPGTPWNETFEHRWQGVYRTEGLRAALDRAGIDPQAVTHVLITHAHGDHFGGLTEESPDGPKLRFPNAQHFIGRADWEEHPHRGKPDSELEERLGAVAAAGLLHLIDEETEVAPGVTMIPTPGESAGHSVVRVRSGGETFYYVGDLFHHGAEVSHLDWVSPGRDAQIMRASRDRVVQDAVTSGAMVVFSHERFPGWGRIVGEGDGYRWELLE